MSRTAAERTIARLEDLAAQLKACGMAGDLIIAPGHLPAVRIRRRPTAARYEDLLAVPVADGHWQINRSVTEQVGAVDHVEAAARYMAAVLQENPARRARDEL
jgi:hypothetical protein